MSEHVVGFDAREMWLGFPDSWPAERIHGLLYRLNIAKPLSTDLWVCPGPPPASAIKIAGTAWTCCGST
jgi:hypothetical protein